ncbi:MAG: hypothetical protein R3B70_18105 [Polyangiaceae bacterium]
MSSGGESRIGGCTRGMPSGGVGASRPLPGIGYAGGEIVERIRGSVGSSSSGSSTFSTTSRDPAIWIVSPVCSRRAPEMSSPFTITPALLPRSVTNAPIWLIVIIACRRDASGSLTTTWHSALRPTKSCPEGRIMLLSL